MRLVRYLNNKIINGCVVTIGNYDGMHLGHQKILSELKVKSTNMKLPSAVIIFEPQPMEFFLQERANPRLMPLREKLIFLRNYQIDNVICLKFNAQLASLTAQEFIQIILQKKLNAQYIIIGDDFAFGSNRSGGFEILQKFIPTEKISTVMIDGTKASSTHIRQALTLGDFATAAKLLGRSYTISGKVVHGDKLGTKLGFPTANINLHYRPPINGVFAVKVTGINNAPITGVADIGNRPTVNGKHTNLEVHLLNFNNNIYGKRITIEFRKKIREEIKFSSLDLLKQQIAKDIKMATKA